MKKNILNTSNDASKMTTKKCLVPICGNTEKSHPGKVFILVPSKEDTRKKWFQAIFGAEKEISKTTRLYVCEDHFNLHEDAQNFKEFKTLQRKLLLKNSVVPHINLLEVTMEPRRQFTSSEKKRKSQNITSYECRKKLNYAEPEPSTSSSAQIIQPTVSSPSGSFQVDVNKADPIHELPGITKLKNVSEESQSSVSSGSSFVPLSTTSSDEIYADIRKDYMKTLNLKVIKYNIENNSRLFLGLSQSEYFLIKMTEEKCRIKYEHIMLTLRKIRCDDSYARLAISFGKSVSMVGNIFISSLLPIAGEYQNLVFFPSEMENLLSIPSQFLPSYKHVRSIIDCFEIKIATPSNARLQAITWSQYKKANTIKYLISSAPNGLVNFISSGFGGRTSDREIIEKSGYLECLPRNCTVLADRGFKNIEHLLHQRGCKLVRPPSVSSHKQMCKADVLESRRIAACRIHIERVIRRIREFKMLETHATVNTSLVS